MKMEQVMKDLSDSMKNISGMDYHLAALQKAYEKDSSKKAALDKIKGYRDNLGKMIGNLYEGGKDPEKLPASLLSLYSNMPKMYKDIRDLEGQVSGDISYKGNKYKRGKFLKNAYKALKAVKNYIKNTLTPEIVVELDKVYEAREKDAKGQRKDFKSMVREYVGNKIYYKV